MNKIRTLVLAAVRTGQFTIAEARNKETGQSPPAGAVLWAMVSDVVDNRLTQQNSPYVLSVEDYKSGNQRWIVSAVGDQDVVTAMVRQLATSRPDGRNLKSCAPGVSVQTTRAGAAG